MSRHRPRSIEYYRRRHEYYANVTGKTVALVYLILFGWVALFLVVIALLD